MDAATLHTSYGERGFVQLISLQFVEWFSSSEAWKMSRFSCLLSFITNQFSNCALLTNDAICINLYISLKVAHCCDKYANSMRYHVLMMSRRLESRRNFESYRDSEDEKKFRFSHEYSHSPICFFLPNGQPARYTIMDKKEGDGVHR